MLISALCSMALLAVVSAQSSYLGNLKIIEPTAAKSGVIIDTAPSVVYNQSSSKLNGKVVVTPSRGLGRSYNAPAVIPAVRDFRTNPIGENYAAPLYGPVYRPGLAEQAWHVVTVSVDPDWEDAGFFTCGYRIGFFYSGYNELYNDIESHCLGHVERMKNSTPSGNYSKGIPRLRCISQLNVTEGT